MMVNVFTIESTPILFLPRQSEKTDLDKSFYFSLRVTLWRKILLLTIFSSHPPTPTLFLFKFLFPFFQMEI